MNATLLLLLLTSGHMSINPSLKIFSQSETYKHNIPLKTAFSHAFVHVSIYLRKNAVLFIVYFFLNVTYCFFFLIFTADNISTIYLDIHWNVAE